MEMIALDGSGSFAYLRPDLLTRPVIYLYTGGWGTYQPQVNVYKTEPVQWTMPQQTRYLSSHEQRVFRTALRRSVRIVHRGEPRV